MKWMNKRSNVQFKEVEPPVNYKKIEYIKVHHRKGQGVEL